MNIQFDIPGRLIEMNPGTDLYRIDDPAFGLYGRIVEGIPVSELIDLADRITQIDSGGNTYVAGLPEFEALESAGYFRGLFGDMEIQVGYCNGPNRTMNGFEYHKSPEVFAAVTDCVLFLALSGDLENYNTIPSSKARAFFVPRGAVIELFPLVLHLSPCSVYSRGFKSIIVLPRGTNLAVDPDAPGFPSKDDPESKLFFKKNKWMIAHRDRHQLVSQGVHIGLTGENRGIIPVD